MNLAYIKDRYRNSKISAQEALELIFELDSPDETKMTEHGLTITPFHYGAYHVKQNGEVICETDEQRCKEKVWSIINK